MGRADIDKSEQCKNDAGQPSKDGETKMGDMSTDVPAGFQGPGIGHKSIELNDAADVLARLQMFEGKMKAAQTKADVCELRALLGQLESERSARPDGH